MIFARRPARYNPGAVIYDSPVGPLTIDVDDDGALRAIWFGVREGSQGDAAAVVAQLQEYFRGDRRVFDLPLAPRGTPFQLSVWNALLRIDYGATTSYMRVAESIGRPKAVRAVGAANGANPIPIIIPCHRVIGSGGALTGYGGGLHIKEALLAIERGQRKLL